MERKYYIYRVFSIAPGLAFIFIGLTGFTTFSLEFWSIWLPNVSSMETGNNTMGVFDFLNLILSALAIASLIFGISVLKNTGKIVRAKLDDKGFYYLEIDPASVPYGLLKLIRNKSKLIFIPYLDIKNVTLTDNGRGVKDMQIITHNNMRPNLLAVNGLKRSDLKEIEREIKARILRG